MTSLFALAMNPDLTAEQFHERSMQVLEGKVAISEAIGTGAARILAETKDINLAIQYYTQMLPLLLR